MTRNLKALGLALAAVFAMSAVAASTASAVASDHFTTTKPSALLTGVSHDNEFKITGGPGFACTTSKFTGTVLNNATEATIDPEYTGKFSHTPHNTAGVDFRECNGTGGDVTLDMNGCHYDLTGSTTGLDQGLVDATVWITCPAGQAIKITQLSTGMTLSIPAQTPTAGDVTYTNLPNHSGGKAVTVKATATGLTYHCTPAFVCLISGAGSHGNDSDYTGTVTVTGYEDVDGLPTPLTEGAQIPIEVSST
jgi:hypothetical protein